MKAGWIIVASRIMMDRLTQEVQLLVHQGENPAPTESLRSSQN